MDFANQSELINRFLDQKNGSKTGAAITILGKVLNAIPDKKKVVMYGKYKRYGKSKRAYHGKKRRGTRIRKYGSSRGGIRM